MNIHPFILIVIVEILLSWISYKAGYAEREKIFQENAVQFSVNNESIMRVRSIDGKVKVKIFNGKKVEFQK